MGSSQSFGRLALTAVVLSALLACKLGKRDEEPAADAAAAEPVPVAAAPAESPAPSAASPEPTAQPAQPGAAAPSPAAPAPVPKLDAGVAAEAGSPADAGGAAASDAGSPKSAVCQTKCQPVLQACLTPGVTEAGLPSLADPTQCKAAFDACLAACK